MINFVSNEPTYVYMLAINSFKSSSVIVGLVGFDSWSANVFSWFIISTSISYSSINAAYVLFVCQYRFMILGSYLAASGLLDEDQIRLF